MYMLMPTMSFHQRLMHCSCYSACSEDVALFITARREAGNELLIGLPTFYLQRKPPQCNEAIMLLLQC